MFITAPFQGREHKCIECVIMVQGEPPWPRLTCCSFRETANTCLSPLLNKGNSQVTLMFSPSGNHQRGLGEGNTFSMHNKSLKKKNLFSVIETFSDFPHYWCPDLLQTSSLPILDSSTYIPVKTSVRPLLVSKQPLCFISSPQYIASGQKRKAQFYFSLCLFCLHFLLPKCRDKLAKTREGNTRQKECKKTLPCGNFVPWKMHK